ncbi:YqjD family protein [Caballeronia sp. SBC2]|uniref:DUF883 family protein n=1 Tax=Caballeronia sp. SBC2 TaxID=2705547 RepID=UPI0013E14C62|nr:hypothetical protein [Caballeronia sp. SBC2]QIE29636.1 hypothetical protein SBC2_77120 [Caballeronia sp. SBC2]
MSDYEKPGNQSGAAEVLPGSSSNDHVAMNASSEFAQASQAWDKPNSAGSTAAFSAGGKRASDQAVEGTGISTKRVREIFGDAQEVLQRNYRAATDSTDDFVHESPWKAITLAVVGGLIVGMLISR